MNELAIKLNDIQSRLNETSVASVLNPVDVDEITEILENSVKEEIKICKKLSERDYARNMRTQKRFSYRMLVAGLKRGEFRNILVMTGSEILSSSGMPDYKSPNSSIFTNFKSDKLPKTE